MRSDYISELGYTHGFYGELTPAHLRLAMLSRGVRHSLPDAPSYLELGFGQGLTLNIVAAANRGRYWGTDFNSAHAANAAELAAASGADVRVLDDAFDALAARPDLPEFDVIALHGIWSWISAANRAIIVDIARRRLRPGGLLYISYNVTPGWSAAMPLRHLMVEYAEQEARGELPAKIDQALEFLQNVVDRGAGYFANNPAVAERLSQMRGQQRAYLAHEFFNGDWEPMPFSATCDLLRPAQLSFAASATLIDHIDRLNLSDEAQALIAGLANDQMRETTRDYFVNQQFRRDIFIKGARTLDPIDRDRAMRETIFVLLRRPQDCPASVNGSLGAAQLLPEIFDPVLAVLDAAPVGCSVDAILTDPACRGLNLAQIWEALVLLDAMGWVAPAPSGGVDDAARTRTAGLNRALCRRAAASADIGYLAAPEIGSALPVGRISQMFLHARTEGLDPVAHAWSNLSLLGERLIHDGAIIEGEAENIARLRDMLVDFEAIELPFLRRVGIAA